MLYIATFTVETDLAIPDRADVPTFRCRLNEASLHAGSYVVVESGTTGANSPTVGAPLTYIVYFAPPPVANGKGLLTSFDFVNFSESDKPNATLKLKALTIDTVPNTF